LHVSALIESEKSMTELPVSMQSSQAHLPMELFRPSLSYPSYPYAEVLARTAERYPEHTAVVFKDINLTYRELDALVNLFANALLDLGIEKGQTVALFMTNRPEYLITWFAITRIDAIASPMNPSFKEREVAYQLSDSEAVAVVYRQTCCQWCSQYALKRQHCGISSLWTQAMRHQGSSPLVA
jgi:long-subunit acyl-CoA synthetase (AMP-forming)